jgi:hypothetical protein
MPNLPTWHYRDPTLHEMLSDPIVTAMMQADGVDPRELESMLMGLSASVVMREAGAETLSEPCCAG